MISYKKLKRLMLFRKLIHCISNYLHYIDYHSIGMS